MTVINTMSARFVPRTMRVLPATCSRRRWNACRAASASTLRMMPAFAIATRMEASARGLTQAVRNANDGICWHRPPTAPPKSIGHPGAYARTGDAGCQRYVMTRPQRDPDRSDRADRTDRRRGDPHHLQRQRPADGASPPVSTSRPSDDGRREHHGRRLQARAGRRWPDFDRRRCRAPGTLDIDQTVATERANLRSRTA